MNQKKIYAIVRAIALIQIAALYYYEIKTDEKDRHNENNRRSAIGGLKSKVRNCPPGMLKIELFLYYSHLHASNCAFRCHCVMFLILIQ